METNLEMELNQLTGYGTTLVKIYIENTPIQPRPSLLRRGEAYGSRVPYPLIKVAAAAAAAAPPVPSRPNPP